MSSIARHLLAWKWRYGQYEGAAKATDDCAFSFFYFFASLSDLTNFCIPPAHCIHDVERSIEWVQETMWIVLIFGRITKRITAQAWVCHDTMHCEGVIHISSPISFHRYTSETTVYLTERRFESIQFTFDQSQSDKVLESWLVSLLISSNYVMPVYWMIGAIH